MRRFYHKRHCSTYRERTEEKRKNAFDDDNEENDVDEYGNCYYCNAATATFILLL